jgi:hypothetical protein
MSSNGIVVNSLANRVPAASGSLALMTAPDEPPTYIEKGGAKRKVVVKVR